MEHIDWHEAAAIMWLQTTLEERTGHSLYLHPHAAIETATGETVKC